MRNIDQGLLLEGHDPHHVEEALLRLLDVVLDLDALLHALEGLDVLKCLDQVLDFDSSLIRFLVIQSADPFGDILEPCS